MQTPPSVSERCRNGHMRTPENTYIHPTSRQVNCRECTQESSRAYRRKVKHREWYLNGGKEAMNIARRARQYGLTPEQWTAMLEAQSGLCAVCRRPPREGRTLDVDHCHTTGKVRGLLCRECNLTLGTARDSPELLRSLAKYLEQ